MRIFTLAALLSALCLTSIANASLVAHWDFDESTGTLANDSAGNLDGTLNGATWTTDRFGVAGHAVQTGSSKWVDVPDSARWPTITLAAWIYIDTIGDTQPIFSSETGHGATNFAYRLQINTAGKLAMEAIAPVGASGSRNAISSQVLQTGTWYHVVGTYDGYTSAVYIDGSLAAAGNTYSTYQAINTTSTIPVAIGHLQNWSVQWFAGRIDDARIYDSALSATQIASLVPEPASIALIAAGALMLLARKR